jgi:hypothetical protein
MTSVSVSPEDLDRPIPSVYLMDEEVQWMAKTGDPSHPLGKLFELYGQQKFKDGFISGLFIGILGVSTVVTLFFQRRSNY